MIKGNLPIHESGHSVVGALYGDAMRITFVDGRSGRSFGMATPTAAQVYARRKAAGPSRAAWTEFTTALGTRTIRSAIAGPMAESRVIGVHWTTILAGPGAPPADRIILTEGLDLLGHRIDGELPGAIIAPHVAAVNTHFDDPQIWAAVETLAAELRKHGSVGPEGLLEITRGLPRF